MSVSGIGNLVSQMMKSDSDKNGKLSLAEFTSWAASKSGNSNVTSSAVEATFKQMDSDSDGQVTEAEATNFFSPPQVETAQLSATTTSSLLEMLSSENTTAASSTSANLLSKMLTQYVSQKTGGNYSGEA